jgi:hypothetical protein
MFIDTSRGMLAASEITEIQRRGSGWIACLRDGGTREVSEYAMDELRRFGRMLPARAGDVAIVVDVPDDGQTPEAIVSAVPIVGWLAEGLDDMPYGRPILADNVGEAVGILCPDGRIIEQGSESHQDRAAFAAAVVARRRRMAAA